jgi:hypothetical protein
MVTKSSEIVRKALTYYQRVNRLRVELKIAESDLESGERGLTPMEAQGAGAAARSAPG